MNMTILLALVIAWAAILGLKRIVEQSLVRAGVAALAESGKRAASFAPKSRP